MPVTRTSGGVGDLMDSLTATEQWSCSKDSCVTGLQTWLRTTRIRAELHCSGAIGKLQCGFFSPFPSGWQSASPGAPCVSTAALASGSAFVALAPVDSPLVRPEGQPGTSQLSFSAMGRTCTDSKGFCVGRTVTAGSGRGVPARGERGPWAGRGGLGAEGGAGIAGRPGSILRCGGGERLEAPQVPLRWGGSGGGRSGRAATCEPLAPGSGPSGSARTARGLGRSPGSAHTAPGGLGRTGWSPGQRSRSRGPPRLGARQVSGRGRCRPPRGAAPPAGSGAEIRWRREKQVPGHREICLRPQLHLGGDSPGRPAAEAEGAGGAWGDACLARAERGSAGRGPLPVPARVRSGAEPGPRCRWGCGGGAVSGRRVRVYRRSARWCFTAGRCRSWLTPGPRLTRPVPVRGQRGENCTLTGKYVVVLVRKVVMSEPLFNLRMLVPNLKSIFFPVIKCFITWLMVSNLPAQQVGNMGWSLLPKFLC